MYKIWNLVLVLMYGFTDLFHSSQNFNADFVLNIGWKLAQYKCCSNFNFMKEKNVYKVDTPIKDRGGGGIWLKL